jgi:hypothetical protein
VALPAAWDHLGLTAPRGAPMPGASPTLFGDPD